MGRRSRKRRPEGEPATPAADAAPPPVGPDGEPLSRTEQRNLEARAKLVPLADGERPTAVTVAAVLSLLLALANLGLLLAGYKVRNAGGGATPAGAILFAAIMLLAAWGLWNVRYWAVLGFQALLAIVVVIASLSLMVASAWEGALLCLVIIGLGGWLFWKLVRALARIQMPTYHG